MRKPGLYLRGSKWWIHYPDAAGVRQYASTGLPEADRAKAKRALETVLREVEKAKKKGLPSSQETAQDFGAHWIAGRMERGLRSAVDDAARLRHAWPFIGSMRLGDVRSRHILDMVRVLKMRMGKERGQLAPRTVRHVYATLKTMFGEAVAQERIDANPCNLPRGELPKKADKNPEWRSGAVFSREELEQLISDPRIPEESRTYYGLLFLTGMRTGEVSALRFSRYDGTTEPMGRLLVSHAIDTRHRKEKGVKTGVPREVPVHPTLARMLATWRLSGFQRFMGRPPRPDDYLVPHRAGGFQTAHHVRDHFREALEALGVRVRRQYDSRRTFISIAQVDGARADILKRVTHGVQSDIMNVYTTLPWASLCAEVAKLNVSLREGQLIALPKAVGGPVVEAGSGDSPVTFSLKPKELPVDTECPRRDSNASCNHEKGPVSAVNAGPSEGDLFWSGVGSGLQSSATVTTVTAALRDAANAFEDSGDADALTSELLEIVRALKGMRQ